MTSSTAGPDCQPAKAKADIALARLQSQSLSLMAIDARLLKNCYAWSKFCCAVLVVVINHMMVQQKETKWSRLKKK
jgi:hypothetical protein